jgi:hypothetical protein
VHDAATPEDVQRAQLNEAVKAAFDYVRSLQRDAAPPLKRDVDQWGRE